MPLAPKAVETLVVLVENAGNLVEKDELMQRVWPDAFVEEVNLAKNVFFLRKLLGGAEGGQEFIETVPKRGYRFVAEVTEIPEETVRAPAQVRPAARLTADDIQPLGRQISAVPTLEAEGADLLPPSGSPLARHLEVVRAASGGTAVIEMPWRTGGEKPLPRDEQEHGQDARATVRRWWGLALIAIVALRGRRALYIHSRSAPKLTDKDTVVLADFTNTTGDPDLRRHIAPGAFGATGAVTFSELAFRYPHRANPRLDGPAQGRTPQPRTRTRGLPTDSWRGHHRRLDRRPRRSLRAGAPGSELSHRRAAG